MLNINEFANAVAKDISKKSGVPVETGTMVKQNDTVLHSIIFKAGENLCPTMYVDNAFDAYTEGQVSVEEVAEDMYQILRNEGPAESVGTLSLEAPTWDDIKDKLCFRLVSESLNTEWLKDKIYKPFFKDLILVPEIRYFEGGHAVITSRFAESLGVSADDIMDAAFESAPEVKPMITLDQGYMFMVTSEDLIHGASVIAYPGVLDELLDKIGGDGFYLLPSSVNEFVLVDGKGVEEDNLLTMVDTANKTVVSPEEILSYSVYHYDGRKLREINAKR